MLIHTEALQTLISESFQEAKSAADSHARLAKSAELARMQLEEGIIGDVGYRQRMGEIQAAHEQVRQQLDTSVSAKREKYDSLTQSAFVFDPSSSDIATVAYLETVPLTETEAQKLLDEALTRGDVTTMRLLQANLARQGKSVRLGVEQYENRMGQIADTAKEYAHSLGGEDTIGYAENAEKIAGNLMAQADAAEHELRAFPITEGSDE